MRLQATTDGLTPLWTTLNPAAADWLGRVPWVRLDRKPWDYYRDEAELPVLGGKRTLVIEDCGRTGAPCPDQREGRRCTGRHGRWEPAKVTHFDDLIRAAYGEFVPYRDHSTRRGNWFWVFPGDLERVRRHDGDQTDTVTKPDEHQQTELDATDERELDGARDYKPSHSRQATKPRSSDLATETIVVALAEPARPIAVPRQVIPTAATSANAPRLVYRQTMINPGSLPIEGAREDLADANLAVFLDAARARASELEQVPIRHRVAGISGEPVRTPEADRDGRFGWDIPFSDGSTVPVLIPGVELDHLLNLGAEAPMLYVDGVQAWWNGAIGSLASIGMTLRDPIRPA